MTINIELTFEQENSLAINILTNTLREIRKNQDTGFVDGSEYSLIACITHFLQNWYMSPTEFKEFTKEFSDL